MAVIETKFSVGDVAYRAGTTTEVKQRPCPDCLGSRKWECKSPAGGEFEVDCPRCSGGYQSNRSLDLRYSVWAPHVQRLTIGQVRAVSGESPTSRGHEYMAYETGIGSGGLHYESDLFATEAEARAAAQIKASLANTDTAGWVAKQYSETVKFSDYQLKDAVWHAAVERAADAARKVGYLIEDLETAYDMAEVKRRIEAWRERDGEAAESTEAEAAA